MDGLPELFEPDGIAPWQRTLKAPIGCVGVGLHSGRRVSLTLRPAEADSGILFRRTDIDAEIPAAYSNVVDTRLCTVVGLADRPEARVGTVEHLMAALAAAGIDNVVVEVDGPEIPVLDGSAAPFLFLIDCAGIRELSSLRAAIEVTRTFRGEDGAGFAELRPEPTGTPALNMAVSIEFDAPAIGRQALSLMLGPSVFRKTVASARTFTLVSEVAAIQAAGLGRGGSLENAVIVDGAKVLNPEGLRMTDEFVRHKLLDAVGDLALAGAALHGRFVAHRPGHALNNRLLQALFADDEAWRPVVRGRSLVGWSQVAVPAAA
jgi:UDP-3-O-[3-hydroxymyristoyl] N-acetylglucosamine deacetylase